MPRDLEVRVGSVQVAPPDGWSVEWVDPSSGVVRLRSAEHATLAIVEGAGSEWWVTLRGRRIPVTVRSWRERMLAEASGAAAAAAGPIEVRATLPGLIAAVVVEEGSVVAEGDPLLTLEAMKMQNEVRAPRAGRVVSLQVSPGQTVAAGQPLLRIE
jgi:biotin carboxyl carrier protein